MAKLLNKDVLFVGLLCILCGLCGEFLHAQIPATTTVKDTVYRSDGSLASGTVVITWPAFVTADTKAVFGGTKTLQLTNGALAVALVPNSGGTPSGTSYNVKYFQSGGVFFEETWVVPTSSPAASPGAPTSVTQTGTPGTTTYYYWVSATNANGETLLGASRVTTTSNATLSMTNYNVITWASVSGATGYRVWRTSTSTAPTGTGNYLVGSTASTTLNDQSNTLTAATVPTLNTTDPRTLSQVRVTAAPSSTVTLAASQVQGTSIVSNPSSTQTISTPAKAGVIPLQLKGHTIAAANTFEVYDSQANPALQSWFDLNGAFKTSQAPTFSTITSGSLLFAGTGGLLSQDNVNLFWDNTNKSFRAGPRTGFSSLLQGYSNGAGSSFSLLNPTGNANGLTGIVQDNNSAHLPTALYAVVESAHASGNRSGATAFEGDAYHTGAGTISNLTGSFGYAENAAGAGGNATNVTGASGRAWQSGASTTTNLSGVWILSNGLSAGAVTNNYGLRIDNQTVGTNNWAIKTATGKVQFGDDVVADKNLAAKAISQVRFADQFTGSDAGAKIAAAIADLPSTGGTVDVRGLEGAQTISSTLSCGSSTKPVTLLLGGATYTLTGSAQILLYNNCRILGLGTSATSVSYSGSGTAIQAANPTTVNDVSYAVLNGFKVTRSGAVGATIGISLQGVWHSEVKNVWVNNFSVGMDLNGTSGGSYDNEVRGNVLISDTTGIKLSGGSGQSANSNTIADNRITGSNIGIQGVSGSVVQGNLIQRNDIEAMSGSTPFLIDYQGDTSTIQANWLEEAAIANTTGIRVGGAKNTLTANEYALNGATPTKITIAAGNHNILEPLNGYNGFNMAALPTATVELKCTANGAGSCLSIRASSSVNAWNINHLGSGEDFAIHRNTNAAAFQIDAATGNVGINTSGDGATKLDVSGAIRSTMTTVTFSTTPTFDASLGNSFKMTLTGNVTSSTISNPQAGQFITLLLCQDATGSRTMTWPTSLKLSGGSFTLTTTANKCDSLTAVYDGTNWYETARTTNL